MKRRFYTLDVFSKEPLSGNPLAIVYDCDGLDAEAMQKVAYEFRLSETIFILPPNDAVNTARIRIFTPTTELSFAGRPIVGAAVLLAHLRAPELAGGADLGVVLELPIGLIHCTVRLARSGASYAYFDLPLLPEKIGDCDAASLAGALNLRIDDMGFDAHRPCLYSAGVPFCFAPVAHREALVRARPDPGLLANAVNGARGVFVYTKETLSADHHVQARMFDARIGFFEDPATGLAAAAFAGVAMAYERPDDGQHFLMIEQGFEMGRPSLMTIGLAVEGGQLAGVSLGGWAARFSEGTIAI